MSHHHGYRAQVPVHHRLCWRRLVVHHRCRGGLPHFRVLPPCRRKTPQLTRRVQAPLWVSQPMRRRMRRHILGTRIFLFLLLLRLPLEVFFSLMGNSLAVRCVLQQGSPTPPRWRGGWRNWKTSAGEPPPPLQLYLPLHSTPLLPWTRELRCPRPYAMAFLQLLL